MFPNKRRAFLEPIRSFRSKATSNPNPPFRRAVSLKPNLPPTRSTQTPPPCPLPALKRPPESKNKLCLPRLPLPRNSQRKYGFDEQILSTRHAHLRGKSNHSHRSGLDSEALLQRKESHLNTYYNQRKQKLVDLTRANRRIYDRINSQTSLYSSHELDKSFETNRSLSRRLSLSKLTKLSSRHSIQSLSQSRKAEGRLKVVRRQSIKIEAEDINTVEVDKMYRYLSIFCNQLNLKQEKPQQKQKPTHNHTAGKENNDQTLHLARLSKITEENKERAKRKTNLQLTRRQ